MSALIFVASYLILWAVAVVVFFLNLIIKIKFKRRVTHLDLPIRCISLLFDSAIQNRQRLLNKTAVDLMKAHFLFGRQVEVVRFIANYLDVAKAIATKDVILLRLLRRHIFLSRCFIVLFNLNVLSLFLLWIVVR